MHFISGQSQCKLKQLARKTLVASLIVTVRLDLHIVDKCKYQLNRSTLELFERGPTSKDAWRKIQAGQMRILLFYREKINEIAIIKSFPSSTVSRNM